MRRLFAGILLAIGIIIMTGSGLCSLVVMLGMFPGSLNMLPLILVIGGLPFLIGTGLFLWGRSMLKADAQAALEGPEDPPE